MGKCIVVVRDWRAVDVSLLSTDDAREEARSGFLINYSAYLCFFSPNLSTDRLTSLLSSKGVNFMRLL